MQMFDTREQWLMAAVQEISPRFEAHGYAVPDKVKVSMGLPPGSRGSKKVLGQCWHPKASAGGWTEIFISATVDDARKVLGILTHEVVHAAVGNEAGHGPLFKRCAEAIGLTGKMTEAMPGDVLNQWLDAEVLPMLGTYPHDKLDTTQRKKQGTRMVKLVCPVSGYTVRTTAKWIKEGLPTSPAGYTMQPADAEGEGDDE